MTNSQCIDLVSDLKVEDGKVKVPTRAGLEVEIDQAYMEKHEVVRG